VPDDDLTALRLLLPDENDARHLFQAIKSGVEFFVTDDQRSIVSRATEIESRYPIRVLLPSTLVSELDG
jgi:riboflavin biosynthesis pyrimidine reductase